jgi:hypothetical protein
MVKLISYLYTSYSEGHFIVLFTLNSIKELENNNKLSITDFSGELMLLNLRAMGFFLSIFSSTKNGDPSTFPHFAPYYANQSE